VKGQGVSLVHHRQEWRHWNTTHWPIIDESAVRAAIWCYMESAFSLQGQPFKPNSKMVSNVLDALKAVCEVTSNVVIPSWQPQQPKGAPPPVELISCANGLLHVPTKTLNDHRLAFFNAIAAPFDFDPDAACPEWLRFLNDLWPGDQQSIAALQEWFGYFLTTDTRLHKILMIIGPPRGGKGTIARILSAVLGAEHVCSPTLSSLGETFGLWPLLDKTLAIIADARLSGRQDQHVIAEQMLSISGEDRQTVHRKYREPWHGTLGVRFLILSNELPTIADASTALPSRMVILKLTQSWLGKEDPRLTDRLMAELPGIFAWSLLGLDRLRKHGHFTQPESAADLVEEMRELSSPVAAFVRERCKLGPTFEIAPDPLFNAWKSWAVLQALEKPGSKQTFGKRLRAAAPAVTIVQHPRRYQGIDLD
jgi:putative DNA primase/helicase